MVVSCRVCGRGRTKRARGVGCRLPAGRQGCRVSGNDKWPIANDKWSIVRVSLRSEEICPAAGQIYSYWFRAKRQTSNVERQMSLDRSIAPSQPKCGLKLNVSIFRRFSNLPRQSSTLLVTSTSSASKPHSGSSFPSNDPLINLSLSTSNPISHAHTASTATGLFPPTITPHSFASGASGPSPSPAIMPSTSVR